MTADSKVDAGTLKCPTCTQVVPAITSKCGKTPTLYTCPTGRARYYYMCGGCKEVSNSTYDSATDAALAWQRGERTERA